MEEFLDSLSDKHTQKVAWVLHLVERLDRVPEQYLKKSLELRIVGKYVLKRAVTAIDCLDSSMEQTY